MLQRKRKLNRLTGYNYDNTGYYFVTICTKNRINHFGKIEDKKMCLNKYGQAVEKFWRQIPKYYNNVTINSFIIMPNHIHGIIIINDNSNAVGTEQCSVPTIPKIGLLSKIIKSFKNVTTKYLHQNFNDYEFQWQRSFYDHIIQNDKSLNAIKQYIIDNPKRWEKDRNNYD